MEELISTEDMGIIDENSSYLGVPTILLMENAGRELARVVQSRETIKNKSILIFAGTGNNGGDSFVFARHICKHCKEVKVVLLGDQDKIRTDISRVNWNALQNMEFSIEVFIISDSSDLKGLPTENADIIVDGLLGTGVRGRMREPIASAIKLINDLKGLKIAIDVPSGLNPDTGDVPDIAVRANMTVTFHKVKRGLPKNKDYTGEIIPVGIGIPPEAEFIVGPGDLRVVSRERPAASHKGDFGKVLVIGGGGGKYYSGAPALAGLAALRTGTDLVNIAVPSSISNVLRGFSPDLIIRDLPGDLLSKSALDPLEPLLKWASGVIIGPGLGLDPETLEAILTILEKIRSLNTPVLVDADAIKAMAESNTILSGIPAVITPHFGEYKILTGVDLSKIKDPYERLKTVQTSAKELGVTLLVKGPNDFISDGISAKINQTGTPSMTVGGTGDVLSGVVGCFLAQNYPPFRAANAGAFINGLAGELAEETCFGSHITASDLIEFIPEATKLE
ncbi:MAG: NAD(P)H-hydrate dehydratase [Candidatus Helarchaeota archaeon]|nr:NAD(P)H-hydrate dehydratase [Candidatus Helarchaeota archaeon]